MSTRLVWVLKLAGRVGGYIQDKQVLAIFVRIQLRPRVSPGCCPVLLRRLAA